MGVQLEVEQWPAAGPDARRARRRWPYRGPRQRARAHPGAARRPALRRGAAEL